MLSPSHMYLCYDSVDACAPGDMINPILSVGLLVFWWMIPVALLILDYKLSQWTAKRRASKSRTQRRRTRLQSPPYHR